MFRHLYAHHQEPINCSSSLWFYRRNVMVAVLLVVVAPVRRNTTNRLLPPRSYGKPEAAAAVDRLLMMGITMPETC
jgi:hypothetical protein